MAPTLSDKNILDTLGYDPEAGFRMLLRRYKETVGTYAASPWSTTMPKTPCRRLL